MIVLSNALSACKIKFHFSSCVHEALKDQDPEQENG